jgi:hypothetical protein
MLVNVLCLRTEDLLFLVFWDVVALLKKSFSMVKDAVWREASKERT